VASCHDSTIHIGKKDSPVCKYAIISAIISVITSVITSVIDASYKRYRGLQKLVVRADIGGLMVMMRVGYLVFLLSCLSACGYTLRRGEQGLGGVSSGQGVSRLFIPLVENTTVHTGFEAEVTSSLREVLAQSIGVRVVDHSDNADFFLLASIYDYSRMRGPEWITGSPVSQQNNGLMAGALVARDLELSLAMTIKLVENPRKTGLQRLVWIKDFRGSARYPASRRFTHVDQAFVPETHLMELGAASAMHINLSRERIQLQSLARTLARQVVDQVVQDF